ncbi:MAG TPA: hypothetical protein VK996_10470 [Ramlibacter sp.]|nr:hypothetical protein [Ramlibacter sp.]
MMQLRQTCAAAIWAAGLLAAAGAVHAAPADAFNEVLEASLKDKKGVVLYVKGQAIPGRVTKLTADAVEMTGREFTKVVVRKDAVDGVAGN